MARPRNLKAPVQNVQVDADDSRLATVVELLPGVSEMSKFAAATRHWVNPRDVVSPEAFVLQRVRFTEGKLKGREGYVLMPVTPFRLMDLPTEIRAEIFRLLLDEHGPIPIGTLKVKGQDHRPVCKSHFDRAEHREQGYNEYTGKWSNPRPSTFAIMQVSKQLYHESASIGYDNVFAFDSMRDCRAFLNTIGQAKQYLRRISFPRPGTYSPGCGRRIFDKLLVAKHLESISFDHTWICSEVSHVVSGSIGLSALWKDVMPLLRALHEAYKKRNAKFSILDVLKVLPGASRCIECPYGKCIVRDTLCGVTCNSKGRLKHAIEVQDKLRRMLAKELKIAV